jgi:hypothetical protein
MFFEDETTSMERYRDRVEAFDLDKKPFPRLRHGFLWVLHNNLVHPLLAVTQGPVAVDLHQLTSKWLNKHVYFRHPQEVKVVDRRAWVIHNLVAHSLIGLFPCQATFAWHDKTATAMNVPGWV